MTDPLAALAILDKEQYLLVFEVSGQESSKEQEGLDRDFRLAFGRAIDRVAEQLGEPDFLGGWDDSAFPEWYDAVMMATWNRNNDVIYLAYQWSGSDTPMLIAMGKKVVSP
jgi:hypothetical protein